MAAPWRLLTRPGCHLCDEFLDELGAAFPRLAGTVVVEDVDSRENWRERFGASIPVLIDGSGAPICVTHLERGAVRAALAAETAPQ